MLGGVFLAEGLLLLRVDVAVALERLHSEPASQLSVYPKEFRSYG